MRCRQLHGQVTKLAADKSVQCQKYEKLQSDTTRFISVLVDLSYLDLLHFDQVFSDAEQTNCR